MKRLYIIWLVFPFFIHSQEWCEDKLELKGFVKSVNYTWTLYFDDEEEVYEKKSESHYNQNGFLTKYDVTFSIYGDTNHNGKYRVFDDSDTLCLVEYFIINRDTTSESIFNFDSRGKVNQTIYFNGGSHYSTFYYLYNELELLDEYYVVLQDKNDTIRNIFEYDERNRKILDHHKSSGSEIIKTWKYDSNNNIIEEKSELLRAPQTIVFTMNNDGTSTKEVLKSNPDDNRNYLISYTFDDNSRKINEVKQFLDNRIIHDISFEYNKHNDVHIQYHISLKTGEVEKRTIEYVYDPLGNWVEKLTYFENVLEESEYRKIEYFSK